MQKEDPQGRLCLNKRREEGRRLDFGLGSLFQAFPEEQEIGYSEETEAIIGLGHPKFCTFNRVKI